jgi:trans-2-enoyl-CoA reductase
MKFCFVALKLLETNYYHLFPSAIYHLPFFVINKNQKSIKRTTTIMSLSSIKVVIIGASSGMGLATAKTAAGAGAKVTLVGRNSAPIEKAATEVEYGSQAITEDIADEGAIANLFKQVGTFNLMSINLMSIVSTFFHQN